MTWILIAMWFAGTTAPSSGRALLSQEFATKERCEAAAQWMMLSSPDHLRAKCFPYNMTGSK